MAGIRFIYSILSAFLVGVLLLVFIQYNSSRSIDELIEGNRLLLKELKYGDDLRETERDILSVESKIRATVATGDSTFITGTDEQVAELRARLDTLRQLNPDTASIADINRLNLLTRQRFARRNLLLDSFLRAGKKPPPSLIADTRGQGAANEINGIIRRLFARRHDRVAAVSDSIERYGRIARTGGIVLISFLLISACAILWFIIDRMRRQNQLIRRAELSERKLQDAVRIKENFMANMSHEIRTPLNSIIGFTGLLAKQPLNTDSQEFVRSIGTSGRNLLAIINDILDLSKIEAGMMRVEQQPFSVREVFRSVEALLQPRVRHSGLGLEVSVSPEVPDLLQGDATRLTQILVNLISNGMKFTDTGGVTVRASAADAGEGMVQLWVDVRDTGIGISKQQLETIFERFSQAESSTTRKYGGTGLGLAIVKELIDLQNGAISVESEPGKGSCFRFRIPYSVVQSTAAVATEEVAAGAPRVAGAYVLVADDNRMNQRLLEFLLSGAGIAFDIVSDGREVIERLRQKKYDLVLMDIQMPVMDGYTASRLIRSELRLAIPIVAMTAHAMPGERDKCLASGMNEYLPKPIVEAELFRIIGKFVKAGGGPSAEGGVSTEGAPSAAPVAPAATTGVYRFINTTYLQELSGGDRAYEEEMKEQFLHSLPEKLDQLGAALSAGDAATASRLAHNLKTTVSIMGLSERLFVLLDALEYPDGLADSVALFSALFQICGLALEEARRFRP